MPTYLDRVRDRVLREYRARTSHGLRAPSYTYKRLEAARILALVHAHDGADPVFAINAKNRTHDWARSLGVRVPDLVGTYAHIGDVPWDRLPDRCVLKPFRGSTSRGVFLLARTTHGWRELSTGRDLGARDMERKFGALVAADTVSASLLVESLIVDPRFSGLPPIDYKVYTHFGRVSLTVAKSHAWDGRGGTVSAFRVFDPLWRDLGDAFAGITLDPLIPPPVRGPELLALASLVSAAVPRASLRVDLFEDADGPVLGELTPEPGGPVFVRADVDRMLGTFWEDAEARLRVRAGRAGTLNPVGVPLVRPMSEGPVPTISDGF